MLHIDRKKDNRVTRAFTHKLADIPDGVTVSVADLTQKVLPEGTPIGKDTETGLYHVVKTAKLTAAATNAATDYVVAKGHNFKVGDAITLKEGGKAYAITAIDTTTSADTDTITVGTTLGAAAAAGDAVYQAGAESSASALKYQPIALVGESYDIKAGSNLLVNAWTIAQIREANIPAVGAAVKAKLTGIQFI
jgi:hypothetical protein